MQSDEGTLIHRNRDVVNHVLIVFIVSCIPFLLIGNPSRFQFRLLPFVWDLGHIALFAAFFWLLISKWGRLAKVPLYRILPISLITIASVSVPIELLQGVYERESSLMDVMRNCLGASFAIIFRSEGLDERQAKVKKILQLLVAGLVVVSTYPLIINTVDTINSYRSFPILSDFESLLQLNRWSGKHVNKLKIIQPGTGSNHILEAQFTTEEYSSIDLNEFPGNWMGFSYISFRIFNLDTQKHSLHLRINDLQHVNYNWDFDDRFNQKIVLMPGWNNIVIDLDKVRMQPKYRNLDMSEIEKLAIFTYKLETEAIFYFDDFVLGNHGSGN